MTNAVHPPIKLFQFARMFGIPKLSPCCCKLETWLCITRVPYEIVEIPDPRKGPRASCRSLRTLVCALLIRRESSITW